MNTEKGFRRAENGLYLPFAQKAEKGKVNPKIINIVKGFKDQSRKDIQKWRKAIQMAQLPEKATLQPYHDLVDDLLTDGHLQSQIGIRLSATLNTDFHIINRKSGEENTELTHIFRQQWFFELIETYLWQIIRGFKLIEFQEFNLDKIKLYEIPQRHLVPTEGKIIPDLGNRDVFIDFNEPALQPWVLPLGKMDSLGIINNIIPSIIWKRNVTQSWAEFCERFGIPLITATTNTRDQKSLNDVHDMLIGIGEASVGTFPMGTDIKFHEANRTDVFKVYAEFIQLNTNDISKQLVGSTMLSDQGTNRSQTEVHERSLDHKIAAADKRAVMFMVNDQLMPLLKTQGYKINDDDVFEFKTAEQEIELTELWTITSGLISNGYDVESDWISKTFNIPINEKKKTSPTGIVAQIKDERYPSSCGCNHHLPAAASLDISKLLIELTRQLAEAVFYKNDFLGILGKMIAAEGVAFTKAMMQGFGKDESYTGPDKLVMQMMEYNCFDFACSKAEERHYAIASRLIDYEKGMLKSKSEFIQQCLKDNENLNTTWLKTEYDLSIAVGQNSAAYVRAITDAKNGGTRYYEYQTAGDKNVRAAHQSLDRKVFDILSQGDKAIWPPNGYGCRCEMVPHSGGAPVTTWDKGKALLMANDKYYQGSQFVINRGDLKQVFTNKQFYRDIKGYPEKINQMTFDKYGLEKWENFKNDLKSIKLDKTITAENVTELFKPEKGKDFMGFRDYLDRKIFIKKDNFNHHVSGYYTNEHELRHKLFPHINEILNNPDEVWTSDWKGKTQRRYIKFYKDRVLIVTTELNEKEPGIEITSWYNMKGKESNTRSGILIKKK